MNTLELNPLGGKHGPLGGQRGNRRLVALGLVGLGLVWCAWPSEAPAQTSDPVADAAQKLLAKEKPQAKPAAVQAEPSAVPTTDEATTSGTDEPVKPASATDDSDTEDSPIVGPTPYGLWVLAPALVAILLAIFTRQVIPALVLGVMAGAYMCWPYLVEGHALAGCSGGGIIGGFRLAAEGFLLGVITDPDKGPTHVKIIFFTLLIGFMVGVIGRNGGTTGLVNLLTGDTQSPRRGALTAWFAGMVVFFDDYANTMIVGPTMRSVFDRLKISRAKLAYIVDSTAAPVASLALIGTWVGAEVGFIKTGIEDLQATGMPSFLIDDAGVQVTAMGTFFSSIPYRFYAILALFLVFLVSLTGRDFGPMKKAQARALAGEEEKPYEGSQNLLTDDPPQPRWWLGLVPVLVLVGATIAVLVLAGWGPASAAFKDDMDWWDKAAAVLDQGQSYDAIFYGSILAVFAAMFLTMIARACSIKSAVDAGLDGMARMFPAIAILVLAWALSAVEQELQLGAIVGAKLEAAQFDVRWMPLAVFAASAGISFATGSSWATMGILCPIAVTITAGLAGDPASNLDPAHALQIFYASVGSVLAGSIFGDHCSPISDTTVLSSVASGCRHEDHVWTQLPYALITAVVSMGVGDVLCSGYQQPWYYGLGAGAVVLVLIVFIFGRRPVAAPAMSAMP